MDDGVREGLKPARWLAWATAGLLATGVVSAGTVGGGHGSDGQQIVTAAGRATGGVEVPTPPSVEPTTPLVGPPVTPPPPPPSTTTVPPPAPTALPAVSIPSPPGTDSPVTTTTTTPVVTSTTATTAPAAPARAGLTVVNQHPEALVATVNGLVFALDPGQQSSVVDMALAAHGNDVVEVHLVSDPTCGVGDADRYFPADGRYRLTLTASTGRCRNASGIELKVTPA